MSDTAPDGPPAPVRPRILRNNKHLVELLAPAYPRDVFAAPYDRETMRLADPTEMREVMEVDYAEAERRMLANVGIDKETYAKMFGVDPDKIAGARMWVTGVDYGSGMSHTVTGRIPNKNGNSYGPSPAALKAIGESQHLEKVRDMLMHTMASLVRPQETYPAGEEPSQRTALIPVRYKNWRGQVRTRKVKPIEVIYGKTKWHKKEQWLLRAIDPEDGTKKLFALADCDFRTRLEFTFSDEAPMPNVEAGEKAQSSFASKWQRAMESERGSHWRYEGRPGHRDRIMRYATDMARMFVVMVECFDHELGEAFYREPAAYRRATTHAEMLRAYFEARVAMHGGDADCFREAVRDVRSREQDRCNTWPQAGQTYRLFGMEVTINKCPFSTRANRRR